MVKKIIGFIVFFFVVLGIMYYAQEVEQGANALSNPNQARHESEISNLTSEQLEQKKVEILQVSEDDIVDGNPQAPVSVIEYASLGCGSCANFHNKIYPDLKKNYVNNNKVKFIYRHYPHNNPSLVAAKLVNCAKKDKTLGFIKVLFKSQEYWAFNPSYQDNLKQISKMGGFNEGSFKMCMEDNNVEDSILEKRVKAEKILNIAGTPTFFINGKLYQGDRSVESISSFLDNIIVTKN